jgi:hypothetical protein
MRANSASLIVTSEKLGEDTAPLPALGEEEDPLLGGPDLGGGGGMGTEEDM